MWWWWWPSQVRPHQDRHELVAPHPSRLTAQLHSFDDCPSALPAPFLMGHYYVLNAIFHALHTFKTLLDLKREVKLRSVGVSNYAVEDRRLQRTSFCRNF